MADQIIPGLWVGNFLDACDSKYKDLALLCVLEQPPQGEPERACHIPILTPNLIKEHGMAASAEQLDLCVTHIDNVRSLGRDIMVHCAAGMERSPLTVAWYLVKKKHVPGLNEAYWKLMMLRPVVQDRREWLEKMP